MTGVGASPRSLTQRRNQCEDTASKFLGQCQHTDWIVLWRAILGQPLACPGVLMVASGGPTLASASTGSIHTMSSGFAGGTERQPMLGCSKG
jgi:hypothetical protein